MELSEIRAVWFFCVISTALAALSPPQELDDRNDFSRPIRRLEWPGKKPSHANYYEGRPTIYFDRTLTNRKNMYGNQVERGSPDGNYSGLNPNGRYEPLTSKAVTDGMFSTYGREKAQVTKQGENVSVPNELKRRAYTGSISMRVVDKDENETKMNKPRGMCKECPKDQTVVVTKGKDFVILPEPCPINPKMWNHQSGPRPGSKIREGLHSIQGTLGHKKKFCQYNYKVIVRQCPPLKPREEDTIVECSAGNVWGSICMVSCGPERELIGASDMECLEDSAWSNPLPVCKSKSECSTPKIMSKVKLSCNKVNTTQVEGEYFPEGSTCQFTKRKKPVSIKCYNGTWRLFRKSKPRKKNKSYDKQEQQKSNNICNPNPCQNGGTCLRPISNQGHPVCLCRPQTHGPYCEMRECSYNHCQNDGLCFFEKNESTCYCTSEYYGDQCQNYQSL